jgi:hypothetical protein
MLLLVDQILVSNKNFRSYEIILIFPYAKGFPGLLEALCGFMLRESPQEWGFLNR